MTFKQKTLFDHIKRYVQLKEMQTLEEMGRHYDIKYGFEIRKNDTYLASKLERLGLIEIIADDLNRPFAYLKN